MPTKAITNEIGNRKACQSPFSALGLFFNQYLAAGNMNMMIAAMSNAYPISKPLIYLTQSFAKPSKCNNEVNIL